MRTGREAVVAVRRVDEERLRRVVDVVVRTGVPRRNVRKRIICVRYSGTGYGAKRYRIIERNRAGRGAFIVAFITFFNINVVFTDISGDRRVHEDVRRFIFGVNSGARRRRVAGNLRVFKNRRRSRFANKNAAAGASRRLVAGNRDVRKDSHSAVADINQTAALFGRDVPAYLYVVETYVRVRDSDNNAASALERDIVGNRDVRESYGRDAIDVRSAAPQRGIADQNDVGQVRRAVSVNAAS